MIGAVYVKTTKLICVTNFLYNSIVDGFNCPEQYVLILSSSDKSMCERCRRFTAPASTSPCQRCLDVMAGDMSRHYEW